MGTGMRPLSPRELGRRKVSGQQEKGQTLTDTILPLAKPRPTQRQLTAQLHFSLQCCFLWEAGRIQGPAESQKSRVSVQVQVEGPQYRTRGRVFRKGTQGPQVGAVTVKRGHSNRGPRTNFCVRERVRFGQARAYLGQGPEGSTGKG